MPTLSYIRLGAPVIRGDVPAAITGVWASAEAPDYAGMAGMVITAGIWSSTEAPDIAAFSAPVPVTGIWSSTEAADTAAIAGGVAWPEITGAWVSGEAGDSAVISGSVTTTGARASTEAPDTAGIAGNLTTWGTLAVTEGADVAEMAGGEPPPAALLTETGDRLTLETGAPILRDTTIPGIAPAEDPDAGAYLALVQDGVTVRATIADVRAYIHG